MQDGVVVAAFLKLAALLKQEGVPFVFPSMSILRLRDGSDGSKGS